MVGALVLVGAPTTAQAEGGRLESARSSVRPSSPAPPRRSASSTRPVGRRVYAPPTRRVYTSVRPAPTRRRVSGTHVHTYYVVRRQPAPAVPPPVPLRTEEPLELEEPPTRPPFQRLVGRFPYEGQRAGWVVDPRKATIQEHRRISGRAAVEGSYQFGGLWRSGFAARIGSPRVDVDTQMSFYLEPAHNDATYLGDTTLNFAPIALPGIVWRVGLGARYMLDARLPTESGAREYAAGWNFSTSLDAFPGKPFVVSARLDRGMLYETPVWRARATVGLVHRRFELFAGYDHTQIRNVALGGPLLGLRAWL